MEEKSWELFFLSKHKFSGTYIFKNGELARIFGAFSSSAVEIIQLFDKIIRLSVIREARQWIIDLQFVEKSSVQLLFEDIRSQQSEVLILSSAFFSSIINANESM